MGIDPDRVCIGVRCPGEIAGKRLSTVIRILHRDARDPDTLVVIRIDADLREIHRPRIVDHIAHLGPGFSLVRRTIDATIRVFYQCVDDIRVFWINHDRVAARFIKIDGFRRRSVFRVIRHSLGDLGPGFAAVIGFVNAAALAAAVKAENGSPALVCSRVENIRAVDINRYVRGSGVVVDLQHVRPRLAAIGCLKHPALRACGPKIAGRGNPNDVGVCRMNDDARNVQRSGEAHVLPCLAGVERLVNAVAPRRTLTVVRFAGAGPYDRGIRRRDRDVADARNRLLIKKEVPRCAAVGRF